MRPNLPAARRTIDRRIVGDRQYVTAAIRRLHDDRRLVHASPWTETPEGIQVTVRILEPTTVPAPTTPPAARRRWPVPAAVAATGVTLLGVAGYALIRLVDAVIGALPLIGGGLLLLALVALLVRGRSGSGRTFTFTGTGRID